MKGGTYILIILIVLMAVCLAIASGYSYLQAKIAPMLVGGAILILSVVELIKELRAGKAPAPPKAGSEKEPPKAETGEEFHAYLREAGWMVGFCLVIYLVGFMAGITAYTAAYAKAHKAGWSTSVVMGVLMAGLSYLLFSYLVDTELYPGLILQQLGLAG